MISPFPDAALAAAVAQAVQVLNSQDVAIY